MKAGAREAGLQAICVANRPEANLPHASQIPSLKASGFDVKFTLLLQNKNSHFHYFFLRTLLALPTL